MVFSTLKKRRQVVFTSFKGKMYSMTGTIGKDSIDMESRRVLEKFFQTGKFTLDSLKVQKSSLKATTKSESPGS